MRLFYLKNTPRQTCLLQFGLLTFTFILKIKRNGGVRVQIFGENLEATSHPFGRQLFLPRPLWREDGTRRECVLFRQAHCVQTLVLGSLSGVFSTGRNTRGTIGNHTEMLRCQ